MELVSHHTPIRPCLVSIAGCSFADFVCVCVCVAVSPVHIVTGASGAGFSANLQPVLPAWAVYVEDDRHGYHRVYVRQNAMVLEFVDSQTRAVVDSTTIQSRFTTDRQANNHKPKHAKHPRVHAKIFEPVDGAVDVL